MTTIIGDTETTGLLKPDSTELYKQPHIIEIYLAKYNNGEQIDTFHSLIKPPIDLPEIIPKITGITDDMLKDAPTYTQIRDEIAYFFFGCHTFVAHNATFDMGMFITEEKRLDSQFHFPWPLRWHCTVELSYDISNRKLKLSELYELATGESQIRGAHRAKNDVDALVKSYKWLVDQGYVA